VPPAPRGRRTTQTPEGPEEEPAEVTFLPPQQRGVAPKSLQ
jgi:hypothetical protein